MNGLPARRMPSSLSCHPADRSELPGGPPDAESDMAPAHTNSAKEGLDPGKSLQQGAGGVSAARPAGLGAGKAGSSAGTCPRRRCPRCCAQQGAAPAPGRPQVPSPDPSPAQPESPCPSERRQWHGPPPRAPPCRVKRLMATGSSQDCALAPRPASAPSSPGVPGPRPGRVTGHLLFQREK